MLLKSAAKILKQHQKELAKQGVRTLAIFGSVARNESAAKSDLDILIDFDSKRGLFALCKTSLSRYSVGPNEWDAQYFNSRIFRC